MDEAEEALNDQYDREVREFYKTEYDRLKTLHQGNIIMSTLDMSMDSTITSTGESTSEEFG